MAAAGRTVWATLRANRRGHRLPARRRPAHRPRILHTTVEPSQSATTAQNRQPGAAAIEPPPQRPLMPNRPKSSQRAPPNQSCTSGTLRLLMASLPPAPSGRGASLANMLQGAVSRRGGGVAALIAVGLLCLLAPRAVSLPGHAPFVNRITAPPAPERIQFGSELHWEPAPLLGDFEGDAEFWDLFYTAAAGVAGEAPTVPVDGWLSGVYVKGRAVSGDMPSPDGSQPFRVGVEQPLPDGRLQVLSTSNPAFQLPAVTGTYYYWIGPPYTGFQMPLKTGEYVSFDTRGGTFAVFGSAPGSSSASTVGKGQEQNAGVIWTGAPHPGVELLMRMVEQPKVATAKLEAATTSLDRALTLEQE